MDTTKKTFRLMVRQQTYIKSLLSAWHNARMLKRALKVGALLCESNNCRWYLLEINNHYVLSSSKELAEINRTSGKDGQASVDKLIQKSIAIFDYNLYNKRVKRLR